MSAAIKNRYDFEVLFDVENGNPNGDPDAGNMPRMDQETGHGLITDVCLKRKIRNYVEAAYDGKEGYRIYVKERVPLERTNREAYAYLGIDDEKLKDLKDIKAADPDIDLKIRDYMCQNFFDIRTFGAVMTTFVAANLNCGQIKGPVQMGFARSIDPIMPQEVCISRVTVASEKELIEGKNTMLGRKYIVPYALYRVKGYISANLANKTTGFTDDDLAIFWKAIINMFDNDHSATRGNMMVRKLIVFRHNDILGNAPAHKLFERIKVNRVDENKVPREYSDYRIDIDTDNLPPGVTCMQLDTDDMV